MSSDLTTWTTSPPAPLIGALLRIPWEAVRDRMLAGLHARGYDDLIPAHLDVLQYPGPDGARPSDLAARVRMSKQALNYLLGQLEQLGYLTREDDSEDLRAKRIRLTWKGWSVIAGIRATVTEVEQEWEEALGPEAFSQLLDHLRALRVVVHSSV